MPISSSPDNRVWDACVFLFHQPHGHLTSDPIACHRLPCTPTLQGVLQSPQLQGGLVAQWQNKRRALGVMVRDISPSKKKQWHSPSPVPAEATSPRTLASLSSQLSQQQHPKTRQHIYRLGQSFLASRDFPGASRSNVFDHCVRKVFLPSICGSIETACRQHSTTTAFGR